MCATCGCGGDHSHTHAHTDEHGNVTIHSGDHHHEHGHGHDHSHEETILVEQDILARNNAVAAENRAFFASRKILALNFVSSPGSGKTELLSATIRRADPKALPITVIEGDQETSNDADRIRSAGAKSVQINTGKGCHLDAEMVKTALQHLDPPQGSACLIENVGNLVCPAEFAVGEDEKAVVLSITEGADKPMKYPLIFKESAIALLNKVDLLPYCDFDMQGARDDITALHPGIEVIELSCTKGDGVEEWCRWLEERARQ